MKAKLRNGMLIIKLPLVIPPKVSKSGKTLLVASSRGVRRTVLRVDGKPICITVNAFIRSNETIRQAKSSQAKVSHGGR